MHAFSCRPLGLSQHGLQALFNERSEGSPFFSRPFLGPAQEIAGKSNGSPRHMSKNTAETSICQQCLQDGGRCSHGAVSPCCLGNNNARAPRHREATTTSRFACDTRATTAVAAAVAAAGGFSCKGSCVAVLKRGKASAPSRTRVSLSTASRLFDFQNANVRKGDAT